MTGEWHHNAPNPRVCQVCGGDGWWIWVSAEDTRQQVYFCEQGCDGSLKEIIK